MMISADSEAENTAAEARELVMAAQSGNMAAFGELYARYMRLVHGVLLARTPSGDAEDLVQEVFLLALRKLKGLRDPSAFGGWIASIARNCASDFHRRGTQLVELPEDMPGNAPSQISELDAQVVLRIIQGLPEAYRETLVLRLVEGMTGPEIAARTGLSHGSVRVNLHRGMELLREALQKRLQR
jgi:RNA polymerase sigma-70 factor (ECF subfamily)